MPNKIHPRATATRLAIKRRRDFGYRIEAIAAEFDLPVIAVYEVLIPRPDPAEEKKAAKINQNRSIIRRIRRK